MKKIIPYILITVIILTGILAPFGVGITNNGNLEQIILGVSYVEAFDHDEFNFEVDESGNVVEVEEEFIKKDKSIISSFFGFPDFDSLASGAAAYIMNIVLGFFAMILGVAGVVLDMAVQDTVLQMGATVKEIGAIDSGWKIFRDVANVVIIFTLLAIGFATILRISSYGMKELLAKVIIVALLINFSLFFTKVIIDSGNLLAVQFYNQMTLEGCSGDNAPGTGGCSISGQFMNALSLTSLYKTDSNNVTTISAPISYGKVITVGIMGSILFLVTAFVFFAGAFLLLIRFVALIFMMVLSPLAFAAMILPATSKHASKWWGSLINYTIFAPIYFLLIWFVLSVISSEGFKRTIGGGSDIAFTDALANVGSDISKFSIFLNFTIVIFFMIGAILVARQLGIAGSEAVIKAGKGARKWGQGKIGGATVGAAGGVLRSTVGRYASYKAQDEKLQEKAATSLTSRLYLRGLQKTAGSSFDARATAIGKALGKTDATLGKAGGKGGYEQKLKDQVKTRTKMGETIGSQSVAEKEKTKSAAENVRKLANVRKLESDIATKKESYKKFKTEEGSSPSFANFSKKEDMEAGIKKGERDLENAQMEAGLKKGERADLESATAEHKTLSEAGAARKEKYAQDLSRKGGRKNKMSAEAIRKKKTPADEMIEGIIKGLEEKTPKPEPKEEE